MLTGKAKADYQRKYMKDYMRNRRAGLNIIKVLTEPKQQVLTQSTWSGELSKSRQISQKGFRAD